MDTPVTLSFRRRKLPHWRVVGRPYFVTIRLKSTLPQDVVEELKRELQDLRDQHVDANRLLECERRQFVKIESILDTVNRDHAWLNDERIARIVLDAFTVVEGKTGWLFPNVVIMPTHVHCLASSQDKAQCSLEKAVGSVKQFSGKEANKLLGGSGAFWEPEMFDCWCRSADAVERVQAYIRNNPVKAGLVKKWQDWPWLHEAESSE